MSHNNRSCVEANSDRIATQLTETSFVSDDPATSPPLDLMASVAFLETHLGCDVNEGGNWGAPVSPSQRHRAGTHMHAARALSNGYIHCGTWEGAVLRFHTGLCNPRTQSSSAAVRTRGVQYLRTVSGIQHRIRVYVIQQEFPTFVTRNPF